MDQLLTNNVWCEANKLLKRRDRKLAAIAYATTDMHLSFAKGDLLICDASDAAIKSGQTSANLLKTLFTAGVELYSCPGLHAKTLVSSDIAVIGSSNLSLSSADRLIEASLVTRRFQARAQVRAFIQKLIDLATRVDAEFIARVSKLPVISRPSGRSSSRRTVESPTNRTWIVATTPLSDKIHEREAKFEETGEQAARERMSDSEGSVYWIRWQGKSRFRTEAKEGDSVIELERNKQRTRCRVIQPRPIIFRQPHDKWTRFYIEDPPERTDFPWRAFQAELRKADIRGVSMNTTRELKPREVALMEFIWSDDDT